MQELEAAEPARLRSPGTGEASRRLRGNFRESRRAIPGGGPQVNMRTASKNDPKGERFQAFETGPEERLRAYYERMTEARPLRPGIKAEWLRRRTEVRQQTL